MSLQKDSLWRPLPGSALGLHSAAPPGQGLLAAPWAGSISEAYMEEEEAGASSCRLN